MIAASAGGGIEDASLCRLAAFSRGDRRHFDPDDPALVELHCRALPYRNRDPWPRARVIGRQLSLWKGGYVDVELGNHISCDRVDRRITGT